MRKSFLVLGFSTLVILALTIGSTVAVKKKIGAYLIGGYLFHKWVKGLAHSGYSRSPPRYTYATIHNYGGGNFGGFDGAYSTGYPGNFGGNTGWEPVQWSVGESW